jgi:5-methylcytosine-specific restriction endonuclease McrA
MPNNKQHICSQVIKAEMLLLYKASKPEEEYFDKIISKYIGTYIGTVLQDNTAFVQESIHTWLFSFSGKEARRQNKQKNRPIKRQSSRKKNRRYKVNYSKYILSKAWQQRRIDAFEQYGKQCQACGLRYSLHVHHITYKRLGREKLRDLRVLCSECHEIVHGRYDEIKEQNKQKNLLEKVTDSFINESRV